MRALASALFPVPVVKSGALSFHKPGSEIKPTGPKKSQNPPIFPSFPTTGQMAVHLCRHQNVYCIRAM
jgi:hypothetical protein